MEHIVKQWLDRAEKCRKSANKTRNEMTEQAYLAEAYSLEVCADQLKCAIASQQTVAPDEKAACKGHQFHALYSNIMQCKNCGKTISHR